jgi:hypothetical protein
MADFVYLFWNRREDAKRMAESTPEQKKAITARWKVWLEELAKKGHVKDVGAPLEFTGNTLQGPKKQITDGPHPEAKDVVGGFSLIIAKDLAKATELAKGCPILELGGGIEVRPIRPLVM